MSFLAGLGSFAGGVSKGIEEGEDIQSKRLQRQQQALTQQGQEALGRYFSQPDQPAPASPLGSGVSGLGAMQGQAPSPSPGQASQPANSNFGPPSMGVPQMPTGQGVAPARAVAGIESGGGGNPYTKVGNPTASGDRAFGKYGVMGANIAPWTKEVLGRPMSSQEFLANKEAQEAVFNVKFGQLQQKYGPEGAAKAWFAGEGGMNHPDRTDVNGMSVAGYGQKFVQAGGAGPQGASQPPPQGGGQGQQTQGQSQVMQLAQRIKQANPGIKPGVLWQALVQAAPMLNRDAQNALKEQTLQLREQLEQQREQSQVLMHQMDNFAKGHIADEHLKRGDDRLNFDKDKFAGQQKTALLRLSAKDALAQRAADLKSKEFDAREERLTKQYSDTQAQRDRAVGAKKTEFEEKLKFQEDQFEALQKERERHNAATEALGNRREDTSEAFGAARLNQGDERLKQGQGRLDLGARNADRQESFGAARLNQGDERLKQGDARLAQGGARLEFDKQKFAEQQKTSLARVELEKQRLSDARTRGDTAAAARAQTALNGAYDALARVMEAGARADKPDAAMEAGAKTNVQRATEKAAASPPPGPRGEDAPPVEKPPEAPLPVSGTDQDPVSWYPR